MVIVLHLESSENNLYELDFSTSKKRVFTVKRSQEDGYFLHGYEFFLRFLLLSICQNTSEIIRPCFPKNSDMSQQP